MLVKLRDGECRNCRGALEITDADDATMSVHCLDCGEEHVVETDAFDDGGIHYWPQVITEQLKGEDRV